MQKEKHKFILFVSGMSIKSVHAIENLKRIGDEYLEDLFELEIIDIMEEREKAVSYQIVALPTLIKLEPGPLRTIVGDLSDEKKVLKILDLN